MHIEKINNIIETLKRKHPFSGTMLRMAVSSRGLCMPSTLRYCQQASGRGLLPTKAVSEDVFALKPIYSDENAQEVLSSAYIHLPFCKKKCLYCDFPVVAVGSNYTVSQQRDNPMMEAYIDALCREIELTSLKQGDCKDEAMEGGTGHGLKTVYFGGGTPSLISLRCLERILNVLEQTYGIDPQAEISIEADPGTFTTETLKSYMNLGVQRVSVGVQAFDDELLQLCGRSHSLYDVYEAIDSIHAASVPSWSLDLISGLPNLTVARWEKSLMCAIDAEPKHISSYDLQVEQHTPFGSMYRPGMSPLPTDDQAAQMYSQASYVFQNAGYEHYELSSYAKPGHQCKHNAVYWDGQGYYAFGMGAASYIDRRRVTRPRKLNAYLKWVEQLVDKVEENAMPLPYVDAPRATQEDILTDAIMLQLRKSRGLDLNSIINTYIYGTSIVDAILDVAKIHREKGFLVYSEESGYLRLSDPEGFLFSNDVISDIFLALDKIKKQ